MMRGLVAPCVALLAAVLLFAEDTGADAGRVESIGALTAEVSDSIKTSLETEGHRVILGIGKVACEIWFRKEMPGLLEAGLVGVISLPEAWSDFRGQSLKPGAYTLRYARLPSDGNHMGAAPTSDFLLMIPVAEDRNATAIPAPHELTSMSSKASGTNHPAVLNLAPAGGRESYPALAANEDGQKVFYAKVKTRSGDHMSLGLVVEGVAQQ